MWGNMMGWGGGAFGLWHLVWWALLVVVVVAVARAAGFGARPGAPDRALEILKERYARGEIDREEFERRRRDLA